MGLFTTPTTYMDIAMTVWKDADEAAIKWQEIKQTSDPFLLMLDQALAVYRDESKDPHYKAGWMSTTIELMKTEIMARIIEGRW